ncbi:MAG: tRNA (5-methylaminomethyl-2-thiouridine)(34)-methyltransferase MnmD [Bacteroidales bacterium]|nr:tRNA (5-methylaminomethyl-2-thiouridine)(34)-methyltransferase MnmD [Bacteroidales bacterium]
MLKIISSSDGSSTIYVTELDEHYHSTYGAVMESRHVFIEAGYKSSDADPVRIFEMGFGTGLNALLTLHESMKDKRKVEYVSVEKYPLDKQIYDRLNYKTLFPGRPGSCFDLLHESEWGVPCRINDNFSLLKIREDFREMAADRLFDVIYYDAFSPDRQAEMWSLDIMSKVAAMTAPGGIFVTYSARGQLKRDLEKLGFMVEHPVGPRGKRQITRALKKN